MTSPDDVAGLCAELRDGRFIGQEGMRAQAADILESQANALKEMEAEREEWEQAAQAHCDIRRENLARALTAESERDTLRARLKEAEEVIEPFARHAHAAEFIGPMTLARWCDAARAFSKAQGG